MFLIRQEPLFLYVNNLTKNTAMGVCTISRVKPMGAQVGWDHLLDQGLKL